MVQKIFQIGETDNLRTVAKDVTKDQIGTPELKDILQRMKEALASQEDGVAIAAPQIDIPLRIFIVSGKAFAIEKDDEEEAHTYQDVVFINPIIKKKSRRKETMDEGCLSVRGKYGKVDRSLKTTVVALDENGKKFKYGGSGLISQIFQHEYDHLDGILFIDKASEIEEV